MLHLRIALFAENRRVRMNPKIAENALRQTKQKRASPAFAVFGDDLVDDLMTARAPKDACPAFAQDAKPDLEYRHLSAPFHDEILEAVDSTPLLSGENPPLPTHKAAKDDGSVDARREHVTNVNTGSETRAGRNQNWFSYFTIHTIHCFPLCLEMKRARIL